MKKSHRILLICTAVLSINCNKTSDFKDLDLFVGFEWNLISRTMDGVDITEDCDKDNVLVFINSSTFNDDQGSLLCDDPGEFNISSDSWKFIDNYKTIRLKYTFTTDKSSGSLYDYWDLLELTESTLRIKDGTAEDNNQIPEIRTYTH
ncbi:MAG: hypothetical protein IPJ06_11445 [Saprospiraceae bacterium]|nr:hypothetical protein [Saprospiraceae bacterium]